MFLGRVGLDEDKAGSRWATAVIEDGSATLRMNTRRLSARKLWPQRKSWDKIHVLGVTRDIKSSFDHTRA